ESMQMLEMKGEIEATHISPDPGGERRTEVTDSVSRVNCHCSVCDARFYLFVKHQGGRAYSIELSSAMKFREPKKRIEAIDIRFDRESGEWQKIVAEG
ncbi:MAG TPA: hypothetical protein VEC08_03495, partial [Nitrososphaerales archaeon]|nr:hypothetical protein [Nitrososphaerales archaeon]